MSRPPDRALGRSRGPCCRRAQEPQYPERLAMSNSARTPSISWKAASPSPLRTGKLKMSRVARGETLDA